MKLLRMPESKAGRLAVLTLTFLLITLLFYWVVHDDWQQTTVTTDAVSAFSLLPVDGQDQLQIMQGLTAEMDQLQALYLTPGQTRELVSGEVQFSLEDLKGNLLWRKTLPVSSLVFGSANEIPVETKTNDSLKGQQLVLRIDASGTGLSFFYGTTVSAGKWDVVYQSQGSLSVNGTPMDGSLVFTTKGIDQLNAAWLVWLIMGLLYAVALLFCLQIEHYHRTGKMNFAGKASLLYHQYNYLMRILVKRDFRIKYQASVLGVLWSFLNPLLMMLVYLFVFSTIFKSNVEHFAVYALGGIVLFNYFSDSTTQGLSSIVVNRNLITKVYMPKIIYPLSKVLSTLINLLISIVPLLAVMLISGVSFHKSLLLLPMLVIFMVAFCTGMALILCTLNVFFRDTQFLWSIMITIWNFVTPIFYPETVIPAAFRGVYHLNPLYQMVSFMRSITLDGISPTPLGCLYCALAAGIPLVIGLLVFNKKQNEFILHL